MTTYNWTISQLDCVPHSDGLTDIVQTVHWRCDGSLNQNEKTYTAGVYSTCSLPAPGQEFISYSNLTPEIVLSWIWENGVDKTATEAAVQTQIDQQINPPIVTPPLPW